MALHYNLSKVYAIANSNPAFVLEIVRAFVNEIPESLQEIKAGIEKKDFQHTYFHSHKIKPTLDLLGLKVAFEEILQLEAWTKTQGERKEVKEIYKSIKQQVKDAIKELKKDFDL